jgi:von Willebrand factor A domain-containing protein 7
MAGELRMAARALLISCLFTTFLCAQQQAPPSRPGWPCVAGRAIDPTYIRTAEATGGQVFLFDRSEAGRSMILMQHSRKHEDTIFRSMGTLSTGSREFTFPVDSTIESLMVTVTLQCLQSITVLRPTNTEVHAGEPDVKDNRFRSGQVLILTRPQAGAWRVRIAGTGLFFVMAQAKSSISLDCAEFVEPGGRPGHEGLFPVKGPLHMGQQTLLLKATAPPGEMKVQIINSEGNTLEPIEMEKISETDAERELVRTFDLKHAAFRLAVEGHDAGGYPYQRLLPRLFQAQPPEVIE